MTNNYFSLLSGVLPGILLKYSKQEKAMVMQPTYGNTAIQYPVIEGSQEGLRSLLEQIEAELLDSEVYRRTKAGLETMLGEAASAAQMLVKAVGREAVRLTFQQIVEQYNIVPVASEEKNQASSEYADAPQVQEKEPMKIEPPIEATSEEEKSNTVEKTKQPGLIARAIAYTKPSKEFPEQKLAEQKEQEREQLLLEIAQQLQQKRQALSLSVRQLHNQTLVPIHIINALETGNLEKLPEDVYLRGFIRRLGQALGLNGVAMAASLPAPDPVKSVIPSWSQQPSESRGVQFNSVHMYLGYTALIAGAVGGLSLMSNQSLPKLFAEPDADNASGLSVSSEDETNIPDDTKPGLQSSQNGVKAGSDIAPPESFTF
ncbi:MAG: hypothetical protein F6J92_30320 [Symploca sp. SIO1A3]|nr:hypothetical protein [Symploca sp. SIO1A3]